MNEILQGSKSAEEVNDGVTIEKLRNAIPPHCFKTSYRLALGYLFRDLCLATTWLSIAVFCIPEIPNVVLRYAAWGFYGWIQGLTFTGLWVLGHECGHSAFSPSESLNNIVGWTIHSFLLTPYYSWQSTHRKHHIYANNLVKDHNYVPYNRSQYAKLINLDVDQLEDLVQDSPIYTFLRLLIQQVFGFPAYLTSNTTASQGALYKSQSLSLLGNSHFLPTSTLFRPDEAHLILLSDLGLAITALGLWYAGTIFGSSQMMLLYLQPYLWVNHWIVAITFLHHTHPDVPKYEPEAWTFLRGATATIDRELGWIGKHMLHNIAEYHVIHHIFSRLPQYHAEEATKAIMPILGDSYREDKQRSFLGAMWESFTQCQFVEPDRPDAKPADRTMIFKAGPAPPLEISMRKKGWVE